MPPYVYALMAHGVVGVLEGDVRALAPVDQGWALRNGLAALCLARKAAI